MLHLPFTKGVIFKGNHNLLKTFRNKFIFIMKHFKNNDIVIDFKYLIR